MARDDSWAQVLRVALPLLDGARPSGVLGWVGPVVPVVTRAAVGAGHWAAGRRRRALAAWTSAAGYGLVAWGLGTEAPPPADGGRLRRLYHLTDDGRQAHLGWLREPVVPETVAQDLGLHLVRFVMMAGALPEDAVLAFLTSLRAALAGFVAALEQQLDAPDVAANPYAGLAVEHGLAVHRASLAWAERAMTRLAADSSRR